MRLETLAVHAGAEADAETGAVASPLHMSTTFKHGPAGEQQGFQVAYRFLKSLFQQKLHVLLQWCGLFLYRHAHPIKSQLHKPKVQNTHHV